MGLVMNELELEPDVAVMVPMEKPTVDLSPSIGFGGEGVMEVGDV